MALVKALKRVRCRDRSKQGRRDDTVKECKQELQMEGVRNRITSELQ